MLCFTRDWLEDCMLSLPSTSDAARKCPPWSSWLGTWRSASVLFSSRMSPWSFWSSEAYCRGLMFTKAEFPLLPVWLVDKITLLLLAAIYGLGVPTTYSFSMLYLCWSSAIFESATFFWTLLLTGVAASTPILSYSFISFEMGIDFWFLIVALFETSWPDWTSSSSSCRPLANITSFARPECWADRVASIISVFIFSPSDMAPCRILVSICGSSPSSGVILKECFTRYAILVIFGDIGRPLACSSPMCIVAWLWMAVYFLVPQPACSSAWNFALLAFQFGSSFITWMFEGIWSSCLDSLAIDLIYEKGATPGEDVFSAVCCLAM